MPPNHPLQRTRRRRRAAERNVRHVDLRRRPLLTAVATFLVLAAWSGFVLLTEIGAKLYFMPGMLIVNAVYPCETPPPCPPRCAEMDTQTAAALLVELLQFFESCWLQIALALVLSLSLWLVILPLVVFLVLRRLGQSPRA
jgi:hypothetical protein